MMDPWGIGLFFAPEDTPVTNTSGNYSVVDKKKLPFSTVILRFNN